MLAYIKCDEGNEVSVRGIHEQDDVEQKSK